MILQELVLHNFGPFYGRNVLYLGPRHREPRPICLIGALNGGGKTSILDAVMLALYGKRARCSKRGLLSYPDFLRSCIHDRASPADGASVELSFEYVEPDGRSQWRITRSWHQRPGGAVSEKLRVERDGREDETAAETWDQRVEDLLPLGLSNLFFFDGEQVRELAGQGAATAEVKTAIRTLLGLELPARLSEDLEVIIRRQQKHLSEGEDANALQQLEADLRRLHDQRADLRMQLGEVRNLLMRARAEEEATEHEFTLHGGEFARRHEALVQDQKRHEERISIARAALRELAEGALPFALIQPLLTRTLARASEEMNSASARQTVSAMAARDVALLPRLRSIGLSPMQVAEVERLLLNDIRERQQKADEPGLLDVDRLSFQLSVNVSGSQVPDAQRSAAAALEQLQTANRDLARTQQLLESAPPPEAAAAMAEKIRASAKAVRDLEHAIERLEEQLSAVERGCKELEHSLARKATRVLEQRDRQREEARMLGAAHRAIEILGRYQQALLVRKLLDLERRVSERFRHLARKEDLVERIEIQPEDYSLNLFDVEGRAIDRRRLSAGEQQLLAVAFLWGLAEASGRALPVLIDTPLSRMDSKHREHLVERYFPHVSHQVIVLSTDVEVDEPFYRLLQSREVVDQTYLISHNPRTHRSEIAPGYFW